MSDQERPEEEEREEREEDEVEEEEEDGHKPKKTRMGARNFIDDMAELSGGEEEEEEEEEELEEELRAGEGKDNAIIDDEVEESGASHRELDFKRLQEEADAVHTDFQKRYEARQAGDYQGQEYRGVRESVQPLPSVKDPKLWLVRCDPGKEQECVTWIMEKYLRLEHSKDRLWITSVFFTPKLKGFVYVEAFKQVHVTKAIAGNRGLKWWKIMLVPIKEMVSCITMEKSEKKVKVKQWVRFKRGLYKGDIAQVIETKDQSTILEVKTIPRIDLAFLEWQTKNPELAKQKLKKRKRSERPPQRLFDVKAVSAVVPKTDITTKNGWTHWRSFKFKGGYLYKTMRAEYFEIDQADPTKDEIEKFQARLKDQSDDEDEPSVLDGKIGEKKKKITRTFVKGDRIVVTSGDTAGLTGRIVSIRGETLMMKPDHEELKEQAMEYSIDDVKKYFEVGDHIKVVEGKHKDETGLIVQVQKDDDSIVIFSDTSGGELTVSAQEVIESSEIARGKDTLGNYNLYDMVLLQEGKVGVITKVETNSFKVLTNAGQIITIQLSDIGKKRNSRYASALDANQVQIQQEDIVRVHAGPFKGRQGTIKHIFRFYLFLQSNLYPENSGIFLAQARQCAKITSQLNKPLSQGPIIPKSPRIHRPASGGERDAPIRNLRRPPTRGGGGHGGHGGGRGRGHDPLQGATVHITSGPWKGFLGIVVSLTEANANVELHARSKVVSIPKKNLMTRSKTIEHGRDSSSHVHEIYGVPKTPLIGAQTPGRGDDDWQAPKTPAYFDGGMTPAHPTTPGRSGRDVWAPTTPRHHPESPASPHHQPEIEDQIHALDYAESHTPVPVTPIQLSSLTPHYPTPLSSVPSPAPPTQNPTTPGLTPVPGTPILDPRTPRTPMDPQTPTPRTPILRTPVAPSTPTTPAFQLDVSLDKDK